MTPAGRAVTFVEPVLGRPSGGSAYNDRVIENWPGDAPPLTRAPIALQPGADPETTAAALERACRARPVAIVDGLLGSEHPGVIRRVQRDGHRVLLLVHMPRPADFGLTDAEQGRLAHLEATAVRDAWRVAVPGRLAATDLERRYGRTDLVVARPGVNRAPLAGAHEPPVLLQLGAISPLKNQLLTVAAAARCRDLPYQLVLVGPILDQPYAHRVAAAVAALPRGRLVGPVPPAEVGEYLAGTDLLMSVSLRETYGLAVIEALARGIPAVVGRGTGAEEALAAGSTGSGRPPARGERPGTEVDTDDPTELAGVLRAYLTDLELRSRWRDLARRSREQLPSWGTTARILADACRPR